jgi:dienelactone hydrolase
MSESPFPRRRPILPDVVIAVLALVAIAVAVWQLRQDTAPLQIEDLRVGDTPATVFRPPDGGPAPAVVIAHGFAGSQQLMRPFAITLARNGYLAVTFDFLGHGRNPQPLAGDITKVSGATQRLLDELDQVAEFARAHPASDGRVAVLGHSMASDIVVRYAQAHDVDATVAVSMFAPSMEPDSPRNLLVIVGAWEPDVLKGEARKAVAMAPGAPEPGAVELERTYGDFETGTARRMVFADTVEHIAVLYSADSMAAARDWLNAAFDRSGSGFAAVQGAWLALLVAGVVALGHPLSRLLPRVSDHPAGGGRPWRRLWPVAVGPALLTPLILWPVPTDFMPVLVADYLALHFAVYGLLTAAGLWWLARREGTSLADVFGTPGGGVSRPRAFLTSALVALYGVGAIALVFDSYVMAFLPTAERLGLLLAILAGTLPYILADEWLTRGAHAARGAYPATKLLFLLSLGIAVALDLDDLFFILIIVPAVIVFFVIYGLFSRWAYRRTGHPLAAGLANALAFAWALGVTFPMVGG